MSQFWGYAGADMAAVVVIAVLSLSCLVCARLFVRS